MPIQPTTLAPPVFPQITPSQFPRRAPHDQPTVLILGAGTFGTSTAAYLSRTYDDPSRITVIDRSPFFSGSDESGPSIPRPSPLSRGGGGDGLKNAKNAGDGSDAVGRTQRREEESNKARLERNAAPWWPSVMTASVDTNRVIRTDYPLRGRKEDAGKEGGGRGNLYTELAAEAIHAWFWSAELGPFFEKSGWVVLDPEAEGRKEDGLIPQCLDTQLERGSTQSRVLPMREIEEKWEGLDGMRSGLSEGYFNPEAGWCNAAAATTSMLDDSVKRGVQRVIGNVSGFVLGGKDGQQVQGVKLGDGRAFTADKILVAAGAWTSLLMSDLEDELLIQEEGCVEGQVRAEAFVSAYYDLEEQETEGLVWDFERMEARMPVVLMSGVGDVIPPSRMNRTLKVDNARTTVTRSLKLMSSGRHISCPPPDPSSQLEVPECLQRETEELVSSKICPQLVQGRAATRWRLCWDAVTPTEDFLICKHPDSRLRNLYLATGGSFHSYKFLPNIGKYISNVLSDRSNGEEKDRAWAWKTHARFDNRHRYGLLRTTANPVRELRDLESGRVKL